MDIPDRTDRPLQNMQPIPVCLGDETLNKKIGKATTLFNQVQNTQCLWGLQEGSKKKTGIQDKFGQGHCHWTGDAVLCSTLL